jgi:hypothetical protein
MYMRIWSFRFQGMVEICEVGCHVQPVPKMNYVLFCQPVLARKEVETIANGGDKGVLWGGCCRKVCRMGGFE